MSDQGDPGRDRRLSWKHWLSSGGALSRLFQPSTALLTMWVQQEPFLKEGAAWAARLEVGEGTSTGSISASQSIPPALKASHEP